MTAAVNPLAILLVNTVVNDLLTGDELFLYILATTSISTRKRKQGTSEMSKTWLHCPARVHIISDYCGLSTTLFDLSRDRLPTCYLLSNLAIGWRRARAILRPHLCPER